MNDTSIRYACMDDYPEVEAIMQQVQDMHITWRPDIYKHSDIVLPLEVFEDAVRKETFIVAEHNGQVIGLLFFMIRHIESSNQVTRNVLFINSMAVKKGFRGKGIGCQLFEFAKEIKRQRNLDGIELQVNARNIDAKAMYEKCGFTQKSINMELL